MQCLTFINFNKPEGMYHHFLTNVKISHYAMICCYTTQPRTELIYLSIYHLAQPLLLSHYSPLSFTCKLKLYFSSPSYTPFSMLILSHIATEATLLGQWRRVSLP